MPVVTGNFTNDRPNIGNASAPLNQGALLADSTCRSTSKGYVDLNGNAILGFECALCAGSPGELRKCRP